ncbi:MAG TPA: cytochrome c oxidase subunit 3 [Vicinamibacterales bacterium]|jgi:heme/copper-type cytochrome/quinol oxidase subunit 3|nr:cytochrome c oxidase subunit 3 [Vicinamibacterales bacterium]
MASSRVALDVSDIPEYGFGHRSLLWWATASMMIIEGSVFAIVIVSYLYLKGRVPHWPPTGPSPQLFWGTLNTIILLASCVPNALTKKAAERFDLAAVKLWLAVCLLFAVGFNVVRFLEFGALNVRWDANAYGSVVWVLLGLHTVHVVTDFLDSLVLAVLIFVGTDLNERRFVDVSENALYWYFVVFTWLPIYAVIYFGPRIS